MFQIGEQVRFKTKEQLLGEGYDIDSFGDNNYYIDVPPFGVTDEMLEEFAEQVLTIKDIEGNKIIVDNNPNKHNLSEAMLVPADAGEYTPPKYVSFANIDLEEVPSEARNQINSGCKLRIVGISIWVKALKNVLVMMDIKHAQMIRVMLTNEEFSLDRDINYIWISEEDRDEVADGVIHVKWNNNEKDKTFIEVIKKAKETFGLNVSTELMDALINLDATQAILIFNSELKAMLEEREHARFEAFLRVTTREIKQGKRQGLEREVDRATDNLNDAMRIWKEKLQVLRNAQKELAYWDAYGQVSGIDDFFSLLKDDYANIADYGAGHDSLSFSLRTTLQYFEDEDWELVKGGATENCANSHYVALVDAIFTRKCSIDMDTRVRMRLNSCDVERCGDGIPSIPRGVPNTHIKRYDCWGDNHALIIENLRQGNYVTAYLQIKSALSGINLTDTSVINSFCHDISHYGDIQCVTDLDTGEVMTVAQAADYYHKKSQEVTEE